MSENQVTEIKLHQKKRLLEVSFSNGEHVELPCAYLRLFTPSAEAKTYANNPPFIDDNINIIAIEPVGNYAVKLIFDDGHNTGIYSWDTLYQLGQNLSVNWKF